MTALAPERTRAAILTRAAIYTRVSDDKSGRARSPKEQEADARRDCERHGFQVAKVYQDLCGASDYTPKHLVRDAYAELVEDVTAGRVDVLVAWSADRVSRSEADWLALRRLCRAHGVNLCLDGRLYDMENPEDCYFLTLQIAQGELEVAKLRKRVTRALTANKEGTLPHGKIPWGYDRLYDRGRMVGQVPHPVEAAHVRELFNRVAAGESLRSIARDFDARGIVAPGGKCEDGCSGHKRRAYCLTGEWGTSGQSKVRQVVTNPAYLGHRTTRTKVDGQRHPRVEKRDCWEAIVTPELFARVQAIISDPRRLSYDGDRAAKHLLVGLMECGACGGYVARTSLGAKQVAAYRCKHKGCVARPQEIVEARVGEVIVAWLGQADVLAAWNSGSDQVELAEAREELDALRRQVEDARASWKKGKLPADDYAELRDELAPRIAELQAAVERLCEPLPLPVAAMAGPDARATWEAADPSDKRAVFAAIVQRCRLLPTGKNGSIRKLAPGHAGVAITLRGDDVELSV